MKEKITLLYKQFLITLLTLIIGYSFLHWIIFIEFQLFQLKQILTNFGIPILLTGVTAWFILRPGLKVLNLKSKRGNLRDFYSFILWIILTIPLIIAQEYMVSATGKLTKLYSIAEIKNTELTKYYTVEKYFIDKNSNGFHSAFDVSGKHNEHFNINIYFALPLLEKAIDTNNIDIEPYAWLGIRYHKTISNRLEPAEKEQKYNEFVTKSQKEFNNKNVLDFKYLDRIGYSDNRDGFIEAIKNNPSYEPTEIILERKNEPFEARNGSKFSWLFGAAIVGSMVWLIMILIPKLDNQQLKRIKAGKPDKEAQKEIRDFIDFMKLKEGFFITPVLIYANIGIYLIMVILGLGFISFKGYDLLQWGANYGPLTAEGEYWRLFTSIFLHGGLMHLVANMYGLLFVGLFLEPILGRTKYLTAYILTGILASIASVWWYDATVSVGASGAIFGLYGLFIALLLTKVYPPDFAKSFLISSSIFIGFNLLLGITGGIDNAAHIGGLFSGFMAGLIIFPIIKKKK